MTKLTMVTVMVGGVAKTVFTCIKVADDGKVRLQPGDFWSLANATVGRTLQRGETISFG
jgi:hypothetical protein